MNKSVESTTEALKMEASVFEYEGRRVHFVLPSAMDHISKSIIAGKGFYEAELLEALRGELTPGDLVIDVGANLGNHTVFFAKIAGCRVAAFEAHPEAFRFLQENARLNDLDNRVDAYHLAVSDTEGRVSILAEMENNLGATRFGMDDDGTVRAVRLDDVDIQGSVRLIKIDVEGMEAQVLRGAQDLIARDRPLIVCEAQTHEEFEKTWAILEGHGYAAVGCFNATDTFLFMPARSADEQRKLARHEVAEILRTQMSLRATASQLRALQKSVEKQAKALGQLSTRVLGDPEFETSKGLVGEFQGLSGKVDKFGARVEQSHASLVEALATFARQAEQVAAIARRTEEAGSWIAATKPVIGAHQALLTAHDTHLLQLRTGLAEAAVRLDQARTSGARSEAQIARLDRRLSEQVRVSKDSTSEMRAELRVKLQRMERLEAELLQQRGRLDALFAGRIFTWLRRAKAALRFVLWPALKLAGRVPLPAQAQPALKATQAAATSARAGTLAPVPARASATGATVEPAAPSAAGLNDVPYMRRPLASLRRDFLEYPLAANALVSVVMTTYNTAQFVRAAAESILAQTHRNLELIVVDDCSTDATREIVESIAARDPRVRLVSVGENRGTYWCKNFGITQAKGAAITFMDSDDVSEPERIAKHRELLRDAGTAVTTCLHERRDEAGTLIAVNGRTQRIAYISQMMRRDVFDVVGYFDSVRTSADDEMLRRIKRVFGDQAHRNVHEVLYRALVHGASLTQDPDNRGIAAQPGALAAPRKAYSDAVDAWHADLAKRGAYPYVPFPVVRRPFPVDRKLLVDRAGVQNDHVSVCLASFPPRQAALRQVVASLLDQVDRIYIDLNQYEEVPAFLKHPRITVKVGGEDLRDNGKFYFVPDVQEGYVFTVDDDIVYPPDYVQALIRKIELYGRKAIVGLHGTIFANPLVTYFADRTLLHFKHPLERDRIVDQLGTGTVAFHTSLWRPSHTEFA